MLLPSPDAGLPPAFEFDVASRAGLTVSASGIPFVRGTWFQYYEPDWSRGYYSSQFNDQVVTKSPNGDILLTFKSRDGKSSGTQRYVKTESGVRIEFEFRWDGDRPIKAEVTGGLLWARALASGTLRIDGQPTRSLSAMTYPNATDPDPRTYGQGRQFQFEGPYGRLEILGSGAEFVIFDGRGFNQPWANGREILWLGIEGLHLNPGVPAKATLEYRFTPKLLQRRSVTLQPRGQRIPDALQPRNRNLPLIPRPKQAQLGPTTQRFAIDTQNFAVDAIASHEPIARELLTSLRRSFDLSQTRFQNSRTAPIILRIQNLDLPAEGYEIRVGATTVTVIGQDTDGLRNGVRTLGQLARWENGRLYWPAGTVRDWPSIRWRGVHMFGGPQIRNFHGRMADRILAPLKLNKMVLQCERTKWKSQPTIHTPLFNSRDDLRAVFEMYRQMGIEPIPLIQSLGHMGWFFNNQSNLDLAVNREIPFTIDPRKPGSEPALQTLWDEAIELLRPRAIHFGCDEIDLRGMPDDPSLTTEIWRAQMPVLNRIAIRHGVKPIFWGDKGLAPGQAIDAAHGHNPTDAKLRRDALPKGAWIADWHYRGDPQPDRFMTSLNLWKSEGFWPIASTWFNPNNIRGFAHAAYKAGGGFLQTTWAGYEHSEDSMLREFRQVTAYVLAADYTWSVRSELPEQLDYDPAEVFTTLYYDEPSPLRPQEGRALEGGGPLTIGAVGFRRLAEPLALYSVLSAATASLPTEIVLTPSNLEGRTVALAASAALQCEQGDPVAEVIVEYGNGQTVGRTLRYGVDVRTPEDPERVFRGHRSVGLSLVRLPLESRAPIRKITLRAASSFAGLKVHGITAY